MSNLSRLLIQHRDEAIATRKADDVALFFALLVAVIEVKVRQGDMSKSIEPQRMSDIGLERILPHLAEAFEISREGVIASLPSRRRLEQITRNDLHLQAVILFGVFSQLKGTYDLSE